MGDCNHCAHERALSVEDDITVVFHKVDTHGTNSGDDHDDVCGGGDDDERTAERIHLQNNCRVACDYGDDAEEEARGSEDSPEGSERKTLCPPTFCVGSEPVSREESAREDPEKPKRCPGIGLFYALLSTVFFSIIALLVKTIQGVHAIEISAIRCFFQMLFVMPLLIYHKTGFLGPRDKRKYLVLRGFIGSNAMILLFYAVQQMPLADATVIMFSNPVFTSLLAWVFLKERCTIWDCVFTVFTLTGVILIARPPFLFGEHLHGIEGDYTNHIKGTIAAFAGAIGAAFTFVVLRKIGKSVHYYLSVWYYAVIGFIECIITVSVLGEWKIPFCGRDRWMLMLIAVLGIAGQTFLTKALQIEKAGPVALMRTVDVLLAFIFQFIFFNRAPTWWSLGGALCVVASTSGLALRKWYSNSRKS
ncbi:solute carrier family 35 member G1 [Micropterus salmoides]|uniref:solute carrier family 35 member G1 n=1 Tax=Micropterus salmoides TaxID=27706 RepID=UPI0018ED5EBD|nr:solute carrier family 35 member G1 [Micropterus salmoides]XP_045925434.1 solute carrier family 35 member G1 [Micropterus dolomieu]